MTVIHLSKHEALDADPKAIQEINFSANLDRDGNTTIFFIIKEAKKTILHFSQGTVKVLWMVFYNLATACSTSLFCFNIIPIKKTQYNTLNLQLSNSQINKLKYGVKNNTGVTLDILSNVTGDSNHENSFLHKLLLHKLLANTQVSRLCKTFVNNSSRILDQNVHLLFPAHPRISKVF